jgi:ribosomal protein L16
MNLRYKKISRYNFYVKNIKTSKLLVIKPGYFGIKSLSTSFVTYKQINSVRVLISRAIKKFNSSTFFRIYIRVFFLYSVTKKPSLTRMGKGSGQIKLWVGLVYKSKIFIEINIRRFLFPCLKPLIKSLHFKILPFKCAYISN